MNNQIKSPEHTVNHYNLKTIINSIPAHFHIKDKKNRFVMVNNAKADFYGKKPDDFIGKTDFDIFPEEKATEHLKNENNVIKNGKPILDKVEKISCSGKEILMSSDIAPWYDKKGNIIGTLCLSRDISGRDNSRDSYLLARQKNFFNALMDNIPDSIYFKDRKSRFVLINRALADKFRLKSTEESIGKTDFDFFSKEYAKPRYDGEQHIIKTGKSLIEQEKEEVIEGKQKKWVSATKVPWYDENNNIIGILGITRDITDRKKAEEKIEYLSFHDMLTGLYNRAYFEEELKRLDTARQLPLTIVMGDLNGLKLINDAYGHIQGDIFLKKIAGIFKESFREEDIISRWGGDEFITILPQTTSAATKKVIRRIKTLCKKRSTKDMPLSISLGVSTKKTTETSIDDVIKKAEDRMYKNKFSESKSVHENLVESLRESLKKRDTADEKQTERIEEYAIMLGKKLNLSAEKLEELKLLLNLHNIGKVALVDEMMSKRGRLTKDEWFIIKELPLIGYRIAESSQKLKTIAEPILAYHEWYNGNGYPRGIKGDEIPVLSRISSLVKAYDAMISPRPYRKKMTKKQAMEEIKKYSGTQFDPAIAELFIEILKNDVNQPSLH
jgi:diguanylate cyclase (GGDEF)-like protein/PAS domain S-box-containing protein